MKKTARVFLLGALMLVLFSVTTHAATDHTPWHIHKAALEETVEIVQETMKEKALQYKREREAQVEEHKEALKKISRDESRRVIQELENYQIQLENGIDCVMDEDHHSDFILYEKEKEIEIQSDIEGEIVDFLEEELSTN